ncbi:MAG: ABC transporter permease subunit [Spirochaetaceae bacterium]|nr:MAG: ABC transporter permease subunit [Spirochaetaceae bacterium]
MRWFFAARSLDNQQLIDKQRLEMDYCDRFYLTTFSAVLALLSLVFLGYLIWQGVEAFTGFSPNGIPQGLWGFFGGVQWRPEQLDLFGLLPLLSTSLAVSAGALIVALPLALVTGLVVAELVPQAMIARVRGVADVMAALPSVVYGAAGLLWIVPLLEKIPAFASGLSLAAAMLVVGLMLLPWLVSVVIRAVHSVPDGLRAAARNSGASTIQIWWRVTLPAAWPRIRIGVLQALVRALGEATAVCMVAGNSPQLSLWLTDSVRSISATLLLEMGFASGRHGELLLSLGLVLLAMVIVIQLFILRLRRFQGEQAEKNKESYSRSLDFGSLAEKLLAGGLMLIAGAVFIAWAGSLAVIIFKGAWVLIFNAGHLVSMNMLYSGMVSAILMIIPMALAAPAGTSIAVFLHYYPHRPAFISRSGLLIDSLNGIPSIVYGLFGLLVFSRLFGLGQSLLAGCLTLAVLLLPELVRGARQAFEAVPPRLAPAGIALGASRRQAILQLAMPAARGGLMAALCRGAGRMAGETAPVILTVGIARSLTRDISLFHSARPLSVHIYFAAQEALGSSGIDPVYAALAVLTGFVLIMHFLAYAISHQGRKSHDSD